MRYAVGTSRGELSFIDALRKVLIRFAVSARAGQFQTTTTHRQRPYRRLRTARRFRYCTIPASERESATSCCARDRVPLAAPPPREIRFGSPLELSRVHWVRPALVVAGDIEIADMATADRSSARSSRPSTQTTAARPQNGCECDRISDLALPFTRLRVHAIGLASSAARSSSCSGLGPLHASNSLAPPEASTRLSPWRQSQAASPRVAGHRLRLPTTTSHFNPAAHPPADFVVSRSPLTKGQGTSILRWEVD
jgi:hypothetical protein